MKFPLVFLAYCIGSFLGSCRGNDEISRLQEGLPPGWYSRYQSIPYWNLVAASTLVAVSFCSGPIMRWMQGPAQLANPAPPLEGGSVEEVAIPEGIVMEVQRDLDRNPIRDQMRKVLEFFCYSADLFCHFCWDTIVTYGFISTYSDKVSKPKVIQYRANNESQQEAQVRSELRKYFGHLRGEKESQVDFFNRQGLDGRLKRKDLGLGDYMGLDYCSDFSSGYYLNATKKEELDPYYNNLKRAYSFLIDLQNHIDKKQLVFRLAIDAGLLLEIQELNSSTFREVLLEYSRSFREQKRVNLQLTAIKSELQKIQRFKEVMIEEAILKYNQSLKQENLLKEQENLQLMTRINLETFP